MGSRRTWWNGNSWIASGAIAAGVMFVSGGCATNDAGPSARPGAAADSGGAGVGASRDEASGGAGEREGVAASSASGPGAGEAGPAEIASKPAASDGQSPGQFVRIDEGRGGRPDWFTSTPVLEDGRLTLSADASARTAREARAAAVDAGIERLRLSLGFDPPDASVLLTSMERLPTGWFKAYVMMTASAMGD